MHSPIFEISTEPVMPEDRMSFDRIFNESYMDWGQEADQSLRSEYLGNMKQSAWYKALFTPGETPDVMIYNGKIKELKQEWCNEMQQELNHVIDSEDFDLFKLECILKQGKFNTTLFVIETLLGSGVAEPGMQFAEWLVQLEAGTPLYIGGVYDYHW